MGVFFVCRWKTYPAEKSPQAFEDQDWEVLPQVFEAQISERSTEIPPEFSTATLTTDSTTEWQQSKLGGFTMFFVRMFHPFLILGEMMQFDYYKIVQMGWNDQVGSYIWHI